MASLPQGSQSFGPSISKVTHFDFLYYVFEVHPSQNSLLKFINFSNPASTKQASLPSSFPKAL